MNHPTPYPPKGGTDEDTALCFLKGEWMKTFVNLNIEL
jgi:hypothetical protein